MEQRWGVGVAWEEPGGSVFGEPVLRSGGEKWQDFKQKSGTTTFLLVGGHCGSGAEEG